MTTISKMMGDDHKRCDELFASAEEAVNDGRWGEARGEFSAFRDATLRHFTMEEEALFPGFEEATGMRAGPTEMMRFEHGQMRQLLADMAAALEAEDDAGYLGASETLLMLMQQHNLKEEQILYPMAENALGEAQPRVLEAMERAGGG